VSAVAERTSLPTMIWSLNQNRVETDFLGFLRGRDDRPVRGFEAEVIGIGSAGREANWHDTSHSQGGGFGSALLEADHRVRDVRLLQGCDLLAESFTFIAAIASSRWCSLVAPTIGAVITGFDKSQASAICARETPRALASGFS
jgi:hypothetical protein